MTLVKPSEPWAMTAEQAARRSGYAARSELKLRELLEEFCRARWPEARIVHEIVMGEGRALTKTAQVRMCGNSVPPPVAAALIGANYVSDQVPIQPPVVRSIAPLLGELYT